MKYGVAALCGILKGRLIVKRRIEIPFQRCGLCGRVRMPKDPEWSHRDYCPKCHAWMTKPSEIGNVPKEIFREIIKDSVKRDKKSGRFV